VLCDKKFHTPTFAVIGCLAFADFLTIIRCYILFFTNFSIAAFFNISVRFHTVLRTVFKMSYNSSLGHMILLSVIRYLITVHPLQSKIHLTTSVVILWCVMVWVLSLVLSLIETMIDRNILESFVTHGWRRIVISLGTIIFPFCTVIILHCLKMKSLRSSPRGVVTKKKMNLIITVILSVFLIFLIVNIVYWIMYMVLIYRYFDSSTQDPNYKMHVSTLWYVVAVSNLSEIVQFSCNPYIYFLISRIFRC
jgi:hypothetical protein